jgi:HK97 family phage major capsid protein
MRSELAFLYYNLTKTMRTLKQVIEERAAKLDRIAALSDITTAEKRNWSEAETSEFATLETEVRALNTEKATLEAQERAALHVAARAAGAPVQGKFSEKEERDLDKYSLRKVFLSKVDNRALDGLEAELNTDSIAERMASGATYEGGIMIPNDVLGRLAAKHATRNVSATGGTSGDQGGVMVPNDINSYVQALRERSLMLQLGAQYLTGVTGNFDVPSENAVFRPGWKTEVAASDKTNPTFAKVSFSPKRLTGHADVSKQLLLQASPAVEALLLEQIIRGHAEAIDLAGFAGPGSGAPVGILNDSGVGVTAIGTNGGAITLADLEKLEEALRGRKQYGATSIVTTAKVRKVLRNLKLDSGSGLFVWDRMTNTIDGKAAFDTTNLPDNLTKGTASGVCSALVEGVFSDAWFAQWGGTEILTDPYTQATLGMIRMVSNQYVDFNVVRKASFQVIKDITTS